MMRFTASQAFPCRSGIGEPHTTEIGSECAYVPPGPRMICATCIPLVAIESPPPEPGVELCDCTGQRHWTAPQGNGGPWVHDKCGRPGFTREKDKGSVMTPLGVEAAAAADAGTHVEPPAADCPDRFPEEGERLAAAVEQYAGEQLAALAAGTVGAPVQDGDVPPDNRECDCAYTPATCPYGAACAPQQGGVPLPPLTPGGAAIPPPMPAEPPAQVGPPAPVGPPVEGATAIVCPPPGAEKRGRGRPKKVLAPGLIVEKLPGADKWCIVHEASSTPLIVGIASKAKTVEPLTRLGQTWVRWDVPIEEYIPDVKRLIQNEQMRLINPAAHDEELYREFTRGADSDGDGGQSAGIAGTGIPATEGAERSGSEGSRGTEDADQGGTATPVPGSPVGDSHVTEHAGSAEDGSARGPADQEQGIAGGAPGILGGVVEGNSFVVPDSILNGGNGNHAASIPGLDTTGIDPSYSGSIADPRTESRDGHVVVWPAGGVGNAPGGAVDIPPVASAAHDYRQVPSASPAGAPSTPGPEYRAIPGTVIDSTKPSLAAFFAGTKSVALAGNTQWAVQKAAELREYVIDFANNTDRNLQVHLGPSEIGTPCDRQVVGKLVGFPTTNHVTDPWPSFMGTAGHAAMELVFERVNARLERIRFHTERKVEPHVDHRGTSDLFDEDEFVVLDHKFLGESGMAHLRSPAGPPIKYKVQLLLYALGYRRLGFRVDRVAIIGWPRTGSSVDGMYVWDHVLTPADDELLQQLFARMAWRQDIAARIRRGEMYLSQVPAVPDEDDCYFCLAGETEVVTREGVRSIHELAGGTHELLIPSGKANAARGTFVPVPVRALGVQALYAVNLRRYRATRTVYATAEHRWIMADGAVRTTAELSGGESLASVKAQPARGAAQIPVAVAQGFTYGDGTRGQGRRPASLTIYGRSTGDEHMLPYFGMATTTNGTTPGGDTTTRINSLPRFWKDLPPLDESRSFLLSWLSGYFAADGGLTDKGQATISSADRESLVFVRDIAALCGVGYGTIRTRDRVGTGTEPTPLHSIDLVTRDLPPWFWVLPHHVDIVARRVGTAARETSWSVESVVATDRVEDVYCATVPDVEAFALVDGITTGNCPFYRPESAKDGGPGCPGHAAN